MVDKPPYLAVHPSAGKPEPTLANAVVAHYARQGTPLSFRPTNRLDRCLLYTSTARPRNGPAAKGTGLLRKEKELPTQQPPFPFISHPM